MCFNHLITYFIFIKIEYRMDASSLIKPRKVIIIRHGERVDQVFGKEWVQKSFNSNAEYNRYNINMPRSLPKRRDINDYSQDSPLTQIGVCQATLFGEAIADLNCFDIQHVFCSPSFRCIQTCDAILKGAKKSSLPIAIESGLFENINIYDTIPNWMNYEELESAGFIIKHNYKEFFSKESLIKHEDKEELIIQAVNDILEHIKDSSGDILISTHGGTLDLAIRVKYDFPRELTNEQCLAIIQFCPYLSFIIMEEKNKTNDQMELKNWKIIDLPLLNFNHRAKDNFDYKFYISKIVELL